jgi:competence protein ComEC
VGLKPLHIALAALTTGVICAHMAHPFDTPLTVWFLGALIGLFLYLKAPKYRPAIVACAMIAVGFYAAQSQYRVGRDFVPPLEKRVVQAVISDLIAKGPDFRSFTMRDGVMAGDIPLPGCGRLTVREDDAPLQAGDKITFSARVSKPENRGNPGEFDWEAECRSAGIVWQASIKGPDSTVLTQPGAPWAPERLLFRTRMEISDFLDRRSGRILGALFGESYSVTAARVKGFLKAMLIGDTGGMDVTVKDNFSASGLTHMISPSGLHVALIGGAMIFLVQSALRSYPSALLYAPGRIWGAWVSIPVIIG